MLNSTRDTGGFLAVLVGATSATRMREIGPANGYSTLWLAAACDPARARITTVEVAGFTFGLANESAT